MAVTVRELERIRRECLKALNKAASFIRGLLAKRIEIRHIPELQFIYDDSTVYGANIDKIIDKINEDSNEL